MTKVPVINISEFLQHPEPGNPAVAELRAACIVHGFFYISGHNVPLPLQDELENQARLFFSQPLKVKDQINMSKAGRAWRGYFPVGAELTSGKPDIKEGIYFGIDHTDDHPRVVNKTVMHGQNQYPGNLPRFEPVIREYVELMTRLGHRLMELIALSLELPMDYFSEQLTKDPWTLFRIFHYPALNQNTSKDSWGVGEHTDYGVLTILKQDSVGGLQIKSNDEWIDAPYIQNTFICNLGDMLSKMTGGYYRATPHRVKNISSRSRFSFPFFFDPGWDVAVRPIDLPASLPPVNQKESQRWDQQDLSLFQGTYGRYITGKVSKVFPDLF